MTQIKTEILDNFNTYSGLDLYEMNLSAFKHYVEQNLHKSIYLFEKEINHNLLILDVRRLEIYFAQVMHKLENSPFLEFEDSYMDKYIEEYNLDKENILNINNKELISFLNRTGDPFDPLNGPDSDLYFESEKIKATFYSYVAKHEILFFIDRIKDLREKYIGKPVEKENKQKYTYTKLYAYELSRYDNLTKEHNYFAYYHSILLPYISKVKEEVQETILKLEPVKIPLYIDKTIAEIESSGFQNTSLNELDKYVAEYNIDVNKLPEVENIALNDLLSFNTPHLENSYQKFSEMEFIQEKFYRYALRTETIKLLGYLKELQNTYQNSKNNTIKTEKVKSNTIFTSIEAQQWFHNTLEELNAIDEDNIAKKGFSAKANAIFRNKDCIDTIFKYQVLLKDYIAYLNKTYQAKIKNPDKLSSGINHASKVEELIKLYKEN